jgi:hypothetical protein
MGTSKYRLLVPASSVINTAQADHVCHLTCITSSDIGVIHLQTDHGAEPLGGIAKRGSNMRSRNFGTHEDISQWPPLTNYTPKNAQFIYRNYLYLA